MDCVEACVKENRFRLPDVSSGNLLRERLVFIEACLGFGLCGGETFVCVGFLDIYTGFISIDEDVLVAISCKSSNFLLPSPQILMLPSGTARSRGAEKHFPLVGYIRPALNGGDLRRNRQQ
jgi:hypothetical protein